MRKQQNPEIDIGLSMLCLHAQRGQTLSNSAIAEVCNCNQAYIGQIYQNALKKIRRSEYANKLSSFYLD